jgi:hypothetical protein
MSNSRFLLRSVLAAGDQAVVSIANLAVGLAFVTFAPKAEYGQYSMVMAGLLLGQSLQNAAFLSPMLTVLPSLSPGERAAALRRLSMLQAAFVMTLATLGGLAYWAFGGDRSVEPVAAMAVTGACVGVLAREAVRGIQYATQQVVGAFTGSLLYSLVIAGGLALLIAANRFTLMNVLLTTTIAGLASMLVILANRPGQSAQDTAACPNDLGARLWDCARWALPSVVVSWACSFAYVYPLGAIVGAAAVADVSAGRLFLVPVSLLVTGWANVFRPRASHLLADGKVGELETLANRSVIALIATTVVLGAAAVLLLPTFERHVATQYSGLEPIVIAWAVYFCVQTVRSVGMSMMLASRSGFKPLHTFGWISLAFTVPGVLATCLLHSPTGVVLALAVGELILMLLIRTRGWPAIRTSLLQPARETT